jgi:hypothetical protein
LSKTLLLCRLWIVLRLFNDDPYLGVGRPSGESSTLSKIRDMDDSAFPLTFDGRDIEETHVERTLKRRSVFEIVTEQTSLFVTLAYTKNKTAESPN